MGPKMGPKSDPKRVILTLKNRVFPVFRVKLSNSCSTFCVFSQKRSFCLKWAKMTKSEFFVILEIQASTYYGFGPYRHFQRFAHFWPKHPKNPKNTKIHGSVSLHEPISPISWFARICQDLMDFEGFDPLFDPFWDLLGPFWRDGINMPPIRH